MSEMKHTPGPLTVERQQKWPFDIITRNANGEIVSKESAYAQSTKMESIADFNAGVGFSYDLREEVIAANERQWADAVLRAAAPELLEALQYAIKQVPELGTVPGIKAAIAKATASELP